MKQQIRRIKLLTSAFVFAASSLIFWVAPGGTVQADPVLLSCTGTQTSHYAPPLGPTLQDTTVHVHERVGIDGDGVCVGPFTGGHAEEVYPEPASCLVPPPESVTPPYDLKFHWNGGGKSTITFTVTTVTRVANQIIVNSVGTVTDGFGQGAPVQREKIMPGIDVAECLASSIEQRSGPMTLVILGGT